VAFRKGTTGRLTRGAILDRRFLDALGAFRRTFEDAQTRTSQREPSRGERRLEDGCGGSRGAVPGVVVEHEVA